MEKNLKGLMEIFVDILWRFCRMQWDNVERIFGRPGLSGGPRSDICTLEAYIEFLYAYM